MSVEFVYLRFWYNFLVQSPAMQYKNVERTPPSGKENMARIDTYV